LWEKVAIGGFRPPFFNMTPMLCIGYAKSASDEGFASVERDPSPGSISLGWISPPSPARGREEEEAARQ
jgi:hypothetical protein